jgi:hypothetical protein
MQMVKGIAIAGCVIAGREFAAKQTGAVLKTLVACPGFLRREGCPQ